MYERLKYLYEDLIELNRKALDKTIEFSSKEEERIFHDIVNKIDGIIMDIDAFFETYEKRQDEK